MAIAVARDCDAPCAFIMVDAPIEVLRERVRRRTLKRDDASEAGSDVLEYQLTIAEPFTAAERAMAIVCDTSKKIDIDQLADSIRNRS